MPVPDEASTACRIPPTLHAVPQAFAPGISLEGKDVASCYSLTLHIELAVSGVRASVCTR